MAKLTNEEIKAALRKCAALEDCHGCVIWDRCHGQMIACTAAAEKIEALEAKIEKAVADMRRLAKGEEDCAICAHRANIDAGKCEEASYSCSICGIDDCVCRYCSGTNNRFEWEGSSDEQE